MQMLVITHAGADARLVDRTLEAAGVSGGTRPAAEGLHVAVLPTATFF